jgi:hypothetical protein
MGALTVGEVLTEMLPRLGRARDRSVPEWPPDVFGLMATLVQRGGFYGKVLASWPPVSDFGRQCEDESVRWRDAVEYGRPVPALVKKLWGSVVKEWGTEVTVLAEDVEASQKVLFLMAIADECGAGLGGAFIDTDFDEYLAKAAQLLEKGSLGKEIHSTRMRILPKRRTPPSGLNVRSLSLHLTCTYGNEVEPSWVPLRSLDTKDTIQVLVVPYPFAVDPMGFQAVEGKPSDMENMDSGRFGFFTGDRKSEPKVVENLVKDAFRAARARTGSVELVLFPELALTEEEHAAAWRVAEKNGAILMAGVGKPAVSGEAAGANSVRIFDPSFDQGRYEQGKHHRWRLNRSQIETYELGATLNPAREWWEYIEIHNRRQFFLQMERWLLVAPLICEDLARPDPVGDMVRAVGPDLVIAFLMDGPQLANRWSARYATVLAEDPGCSVLTITSLGMALRSQPPAGMPKSRKVASWKDPVGGYREIEVSADKDVVLLLTLHRDTRRRSGYRQVSADGRENGVSTGFPILSRVQSVEIADYRNSEDGRSGS